MSLIDYWFDPANEHLWFNATKADDEVIYNRWKSYVPQSILEGVIYFDQIERHIARHLNVLYDATLTTTALNLSEQLIVHYFDYTPKQITFILLPFRHTNDISHITYARDFILKLMVNDYDAIYDRFYYATIKQLVQLTGVGLSNAVGYINKEILCSAHKDIDDVKPPKFISDKYTISLSGGVDSMVCLHLAAEQKLDVIALHINYNNRDTTHEIALLQFVCRSLSIPLYIRHITEIQRSRDRHRDFYEQITKEIRFAAYRELGRKVILGHNETDCEENIFNNIKKWRSLDNLKGMTPFSEINGVVIYRPMLSISKEQMHFIANERSIPYLKNSTPSWSERGKTRDEILPVLPHETRRNLLQLSSVVHDLYEMAKVSVEQLIIINGCFTTTIKSRVFFELIFQRMSISISKKSMDNFITQLKKSDTRITLNIDWYIIKKLDSYSLFKF